MSLLILIALSTAILVAVNQQEIKRLKAVPNPLAYQPKLGNREDLGCLLLFALDAWITFLIMNIWSLAKIDQNWLILGGVALIVAPVALGIAIPEESKFWTGPGKYLGYVIALGVMITIGAIFWNPLWRIAAAIPF